MSGEIAWTFIKMPAMIIADRQNWCWKTLPADEPQGGDKEEHIDALIDRAKTLLGCTLYRDIFQTGLNTILEDIKIRFERVRRGLSAMVFRTPADG